MSKNDSHEDLGNEPESKRTYADSESLRKRDARTFLIDKHEGRRITAYHAFRERLANDFDFLKDAPAVTSAVRRVFNSVFDREDMYSTGNPEALSKVYRSAVEKLKETLIMEKFCTEESVDATIRDMAEQARRSVREIPAAPIPDGKETQQDFINALLQQFVPMKQDPLEDTEAEKKLRPQDNQRWLDSTLRALIHSSDHAMNYYSRQTTSLQKAIASETYTEDLMWLLQRACRTEKFDADTAVSTAAVILRDIYQNAPEMLKHPDLESLYNVRFSYKGKSNSLLPKQQLVNNNIISEAATVVLLGCQQQIAREAAIIIARSLQMHTNSGNDDYVPASKKILGEHMEALNAFINKLAEMRFLHPNEQGILDRNQKRIEAVMCEYAEHQAGRGDTRGSAGR